MGNGFQEVIYQRCLAIELEKNNLGFVREKEQAIYYHDIYVGTRRVDFMVEDKVLIELKAVSELNNIHLAQTLNYLQAYNLEIGLLINFGSTRLQYRRLINSSNSYQHYSS